MNLAPLINFAKRFKGFLALAAFILLLLLAAVTYLFSQGSFDQLLSNFGRLSPDQFAIFVYLFLGLSFFVVVLLIILGYRSTRQDPQRGEDIMYVHVRDAKTKERLAGATVYWNYRGTKEERTDSRGEVRFTFPDSYHGETATIEASKEGYENKSAKAKLGTKTDVLFDLSEITTGIRTDPSGTGHQGGINVTGIQPPHDTDRATIAKPVAEGDSDCTETEHSAKEILVSSGGSEVLVQVPDNHVPTGDPNYPGLEGLSKIPLAGDSNYLAGDLPKEKLRKELGIDFLTVGLPEVAAKFGADQDLSLIILDIDELTIINKQYSHEVGDAVIEAIGRILFSEAGTPYTGRCGDDTYYATLLGSSIDNALAIANRLRLAIARYPWESIASGLRVTCSFGVAQLKEQEPILDWVVRAGIGFITAKKRDPSTTPAIVDGGPAVRPHGEGIALAPRSLSKKQTRELKHYWS